jgi:FRG domain
VISSPGIKAGTSIATVAHRLAIVTESIKNRIQTGDHLDALQKFRRECWAFGLTATRGSEDLAVAQHSGLATHLLDWTTNPLVALFFACGEDRDNDGTALRRRIRVNNPERVPEGDIEGDKWMDIKGLKLYNPRLIDPRITRQKGLFTIQGVEDKPVKDLVASAELVTRVVPAVFKQTLLEILFMMGIDRSTLFPDPDGLCARINWETSNRIKRDFPPVSGARIIYAQAHIRVGAESESTSSFHPRLRDPEKEEALRALIENGLKSLERLISVAEESPLAAIIDSWEILSKSVIETAELFGFRRDEEGDSDLSQAVFYLTVDVL